MAMLNNQMVIRMFTQRNLEGNRLSQRGNLAMTSDAA